LLDSLKLILSSNSLGFVLNLVGMALQNSFSMGSSDLGDGGILGNAQHHIWVEIGWRGHVPGVRVCDQGYQGFERGISNPP
jgi:hypothetical protein